MDRATKRALAQLDRNFTDQFAMLAAAYRSARDVLYHATVATWGWWPCDAPNHNHPTQCGRCPNCVELARRQQRLADAKYNRDRAKLDRDGMRRRLAMARAAVLAGQPAPPPAPELPEPPLSERAREIRVILAALRERRATLDKNIRELEAEFLREKHQRPAGQEE